MKNEKAKTTMSGNGLQTKLVIISFKRIRQTNTCAHTLISMRVKRGDRTIATYTKSQEQEKKDQQKTEKINKNTK